MKSILLSLYLGLFASANLLAQPKVDTSYRSTYYEQKVTMFNQLPNTKREIIFLGDSITDIGAWDEIWGKKSVKNRGISGDNTFGVLARLTEVTSSKPSRIFIMIGVNDIAKNTPDEIIVSNYKKIIDNIRIASPSTKIIVQSILPTNNNFTEFKNHQNKTAHIVFVNNALENLCKEYDLVYVDLHGAFLDDENKLNKQYTNDGLHINGFGYMKWKEILLEKQLMQ